MNLYIKISSELVAIKVFFFVNLRSYLTQDELNELYKMVDYYKVSLILLESIERNERSREKRYIIDKDLCFIDVN